MYITQKEEFTFQLEECAVGKGTLDIESTVGVGTKVLITIPKEAQP